MVEKFIVDVVTEQQRIAQLIVKLKTDITQVRDSVNGKEAEIQALAGKLDVLKQVHEFYTKGSIAQPEQQEQQAPQEQPPYEAEQEPQSVFTAEQQQEQQP
tara:strand:+ start:539 stop:841 length:303 start_codon:yes stop_codon:yes gene_type:complete